MKHALQTFAVLLAIGQCVSAAVKPNNQVAKEAIEAALRGAIRKPEGNLTQADRQKIIRLGLAGKQISDLTPLIELPNLQQLWLHNNRLQDIGPLAKLKKLC